jgi:Family of unknown function (DUF6152)
MKRSFLFGFVATVILTSVVTAYAHHSFAATYQEDKKIQIEGKIASFTFRNPHSFLYINAPDEAGTMQRWTIEWGGAGVLEGQGITRDTLKPGDVVVITGSPGRDVTEHRMRMASLRRTSDGFGWGNKPGEKFD